MNIWTCAVVVVLFGLTQSSGYATEGKKRVGVVDLESNFGSFEERRNLLNAIRARLAAKLNWYVLSEQETESRLVQSSAIKSDLEHELQDQEKRKAEVKGLLEQGKNFYLGSQFEDAVRSLDSAFKSLNSIALVVTPELPLEILKYLAAAHFFLGEEEVAKSFLSASLEVDPSAAVETDRFPPPFIQVFNSIQSSQLTSWDLWQADASVSGLRAKFLGIELKVTEEKGKISLKVPRGHSVLGSQMLVLFKEDFKPSSFLLANLPSSVRLDTTQSSRRPTKGLFVPLVPDVTPPTELKWFQDQLQVSNLFLGSVFKDTEGHWSARVQVLEAKTNRLSAIVSSTHENLSTAVDQAVDQLLLSVDRDSAPPKSISAGRSSEATLSPSDSEPAFYKTWWFWTLAGGVAAGAGVGTYLLLNQKDSLQFEMRAN